MSNEFMIEDGEKFQKISVDDQMFKDIVEKKQSGLRHMIRMKLGDRQFKLSVDSFEYIH